MADFVSINVERADPVSGKLVIGDGTGKRIEWHKRVSAIDTAVASLSDIGYLTLAAGLTISAFGAGVVVSNSSGVLSVSAGGITLGGDVTGPSANNTAIALTGAGGFVDMKSPQLLFAAGLASATVTQTSASAAGKTLSVAAQSSTANRGGHAFFGSGNGGSGNLPGDIHFLSGITTGPALSLLANAPAPIAHFYTNSIRWDKSCTTPIFYQEPQTSDVRPPDLIIRSSAPWVSSLDHGSGDNRQLAGDIYLEIPARAGVSDPSEQGHYELRIADDARLAVFASMVQLSPGILEFVRQTSGSTAAIRIAAPVTGETGGVGITFEAQDGGPGGSGNNPGGSLVFSGGLPSGAGQPGGGVIVQVGDGRQPMAQFVQIDSLYINAIGFPALLGPSDINEDNSNVVLLGNAYKLDGVGARMSPGSGLCLLASATGLPCFQTTNGDWISFDLRSTAPATAIDSPADYIRINVNGNAYCVPVYGVP